MSSELRLATLSKLLDNPSAVVQKRLGEELRRVEIVLQRSTDYDDLEQALKILGVLAPKFHGAVIPALRAFVRSVSSRVLTQAGEPIPEPQSRYRSTSRLLREAIQVPHAIRYVHLQDFADLLLELSQSLEDDVRNKAAQALEGLAEFNLHDFSILGARPQADLIAHLGSLPDDDLAVNSDAILRALQALLSPTMEGYTWTYNTLTISRGAIQGGNGIPELRDAAIRLLQRMYWLKGSVAYRKGVLIALDAATRRELAAVDEQTKGMFEQDAVAVLRFLRELVRVEALPLVQRIEHDAYWDYFHAASKAVEMAALEVRDAIAGHSEYQIYKQLIGFEGIIGQWEKLRTKDEEWDHSNKKRLEAAREYVDAIDEASYAEWRARILSFSETKSDDLATFSVFYDFLELTSRERPNLALELVQLHEERMRPFLIPLIAGLWESSRRAEVAEIVERWIEDGTHLVAVAKSVLRLGAEGLATLSRVIIRAIQLDERDAVVTAMGVAARLFGTGAPEAKEVFMLGMRELATRRDASWVSAAWYGKDFRSLMGGLEPSERVEVLESMLAMPELDHQAEEVLYAIGRSDFQSVLEFISGRLQHENAARAKSAAEDQRFEAVPYQPHGLKLLEWHPSEVVAIVRRSFDETSRAIFPFASGARLLKAVYPSLGDSLLPHLLKLLESGNAADAEFVAAIVRAYGGDAPIFEVCKAIVSVVPERSPIWNVMAAALETTGGVMGEYGLADALQRKHDVIAGWKSDDSERIRAFANWLTPQLQRLIERERRDADEQIAMRRYKYGE